MTDEERARVLLAEVYRGVHVTTHPDNSVETRVETSKVGAAILAAMRESKIEVVKIVLKMAEEYAGSIDGFHDLLEEYLTQLEKERDDDKVS